MRRKEALIAVVGGIVGAILAMAVGSFVRLEAQSQSDAIFSKITCREIEVVAYGRTVARIGSSVLGGPEIMLYSRNGKPSVQMHDGRMLLTSTDNRMGVSLSAKSIYAQKVDPIFNLGDAGWGELVLFNGENAENDAILPMALSGNKVGCL